MRLSIGGAESNVAIGLARLGTESVWIGRVGDDRLGQRIRRELNAEGVQSHVVVDESASTGLMIRERRTAETTQVWYYRKGSAGSKVQPADIPAQLVSRASVLHLTGITPALSDSARATVFRAIKIARDNGVIVSFDVNHRTKLWSTKEATSVYLRMARESDIIFAGEEEARILAPSARSIDQLAESITALGPRQVIIKLGSEGCAALIDSASYRLPAVPIVPVDSVGAGDAFVAGYLSELVSGGDVERRLHTAVCVGAFQCLTVGDWEGLPTRQELMFMKSADPVTR